MKRITIEISAFQRHALEWEAYRNGTTISEEIRESLSKTLKNEYPRSRTPKR